MLLTLSHQTMRVDPDGRPVAEDVAEELGRRRGLVFVVARIAEVVVRLAQVAEPLDVVNEDIDRRLIVGCRFLAALDFRGQPGEGRGQVAPGHVGDRVRQDVLEPAELSDRARIDRAAVQEVEAARLRTDRRMLRGDARRPP